MFVGLLASVGKFAFQTVGGHLLSSSPVTKLEAAVSGLGARFALGFGAAILRPERRLSGAWCRPVHQSCPGGRQGAHMTLILLLALLAPPIGDPVFAALVETLKAEEGYRAKAVPRQPRRTHHRLRNQHPRRASPRPKQTSC